MKTRYNGTITLEIIARSPYYQAYFVTADGRRRHRSTKVPHAGGLFHGEKLTAKQAKLRAAIVAHELACAACPGVTPDATIADAVREHVKQKQKKVGLTRLEKISACLTRFLEWLPRGGDTIAAEVTRGDVETFICSQWGLCRESTQRFNYTILKDFFAGCVDAGAVSVSPCTRRRGASNSAQKITREIFTEQELATIFSNSPPEIVAAVKICLGTYGQRMSDVIRLPWRAVDFARREVRIVTGKTKTPLVLPLQNWFFDWLTERRKTSATETVLGFFGAASTLSTRFSAELVRLGIAASVPGAPGQRGHKTKSFHCLRATVVTMLHAAGVSEGMAMRLVGHASRLVHEIYCRPTVEQLADAAARLPSFE